MDLLGGRNLPMICFAVDTSWYRGPNPSAQVPEQWNVVGGSALPSIFNPVNAQGSTEHYASSAATDQARRGIVPAADVAEDGAKFDALPRAVGVGSPLGVVTPSAVGEEYEDSSTGSIWISNGTTNASWTEKEARN